MLENSDIVIFFPLKGMVFQKCFLNRFVHFFPPMQKLFKLPSFKQIAAIILLSLSVIIFQSNVFQMSYETGL